MQLTDAIKLANSEHVVYFLLAAYVETLDYYDPARSSVPPHVKRLPMAGKADVIERLRTLRDSLRTHTQGRFKERAVMQEAVDVFTAACQRLRTLKTTDSLVRPRLTQLYVPDPHARKAVPWMRGPSHWTKE